MRKPNVWMLICIFVILAMITMILAHQRKINLNFFNASQLANDLQYYIISTLLYFSFKSKSGFWSLMFFWVSMDTVGRTGIATGIEKNAWYALFSLFTCTFTLSQYKPNVPAARCFAIMGATQLLMVNNWINGHNQTVLYLNYDYIIAGINILTISTLIKWDGLLRLRADIIYMLRVLWINFTHVFARRFYI